MIIRFCSDCNRESNKTEWSEYFRARLCMDCYNLRCEEEHRGYAMNDHELWVEAGKP